MGANGRRWLGALIAMMMVAAGGSDALAGEPREIAQVGQAVGKGWRLVEMGSLVAANDRGQVAYVAEVRKGSRTRTALIRNRRQMLWEGKRLADGSRIADISHIACPTINEKGKVAVYARISGRGGQRTALIVGNRPVVWLGRKVRGRTITKLNPNLCAPLDKRGRPAFVAWFETRSSGRVVPGRCRRNPTSPCPLGVFVGKRADLLAGRRLADGSVVQRINDEVAMNASGRFVVAASLATGERALVSRDAVVLRDLDPTTDGRRVRLFGLEIPVLNNRGDFAVAALPSLETNDVPVVVDRNEVVLEGDVELVDRAVVKNSFLRVALSDDGTVAVLTSVEQQGRRSLGIVTQHGSVVSSGDLLADGRRIDRIETPVLTGSGDLAFVAELDGKETVMLGEPTRGCRNRFHEDVPVPDGYGAAYGIGGLRASGDIRVQARCGFGEALLQVGTGRVDELVNPDAFIRVDGAWQPIRLRGGERGEGGWFRGKAVARLDLSDADLENEQLVAAQTCTRFRGDLKCGCRDVSCQEPFWQLQAFRRPASNTPEPDPPLDDLPEPPPLSELPVIEQPTPPLPEPPDDPGDPNGPGAKVFNKCRACHVADEERNKVGPHLVGIFGRPAGAVEDYRYSTAMRESGLVWNDATLTGFLVEPRAFVSGTSMAFPGLRNAQELQDLLDYLRVVAGSTP